jgi:hypothetical protein
VVEGGVVAVTTGEVVVVVVVDGERDEVVDSPPSPGLHAVTTRTSENTAFHIRYKLVMRRTNTEGALFERHTN